MKYRCNTPTCDRYKDYGGRGIQVSPEWNDSYEPFYNWAMQNGYKKGLTLDRIDNDGNYEPSNCRWVTNVVQGRNKDVVHMVTIDGETKRIKEWCADYNISYDTVMTRYSTYDWELERAITTPVRLRKNPSGFTERAKLIN